MMLEEYERRAESGSVAPSDVLTLVEEVRRLQAQWQKAVDAIAQQQAEGNGETSRAWACYRVVMGEE